MRERWQELQVAGDCLIGGTARWPSGNALKPDTRPHPAAAADQLSGTLPSRNESLPALGLQPGRASEAALPVLGSFDVERNSLSGTLPRDLLGSGSVAELRAGFNQLSGE